MLRVRNFLLVGILILCGSSGIPAQESDEATRIHEIVLEGNRRTTRSYILSKIESAVGKPFLKDTLAEDIKRLYRLGLFSRIAVDQKRLPEGMQIKFVLVENVLVDRIVIRGNVEYEDSDLREIMKLRSGRPLIRYMLTLDKDRIRDHYLEEGYLFVKVTVQSNPTIAGEEVIVRILEGPQVSIEEIRFKGNLQVKDKQLLRVMETQESRWYRSEVYREDVLVQDVVSIRNYYRTQGFLDVQAEVSDFEFSDEKSELSITIHIEEGPRYRVESIGLEGVKLFNEKEVRSRFKQKEGKYFDQESIVKDRSKIETMYRDNAFIECTVEIKYLYSVEGPLVGILYRVKEGIPYRIDRVKIRGNIQTRDDVIRRRIKVYPGEYINTSKIRESQRKLREDGYYEKIDLDLKPGDLPGTKNLIFDVTEGRTGTIRFAAGVTSNAGLIGDVSLSKKNFDLADLPKSWSEIWEGSAFTGGGQEILFQFQPGSELIRNRFRFREPYLFGYPYSFSVDYQYLSRDRESFDETRNGATLAWGHEVSDDLRLELGYRIEDVEIEDVDSDAPFLVRQAKGSTFITSTILSGVLDRRDNSILPTRGYKLSSSLEAASEALGGDSEFVKYQARASWHRKMMVDENGYPHVLNLSARFGWVEEYGGSSQVPVFEKFYAGGFGSFRGFEYRGIGPHQGDDPVGGRVLAIGSVEYGLPAYRDVLRVVLFSDFGTVARRISSSEMGDIRLSVGMGIRLKLPFLGQRPFALDFGFALLKEDDDDRDVIHFSIGREF